MHVRFEWKSRPVVIQPILDQTIRYVNVPAVVGYEGLFMDVLGRDFEELGLSVWRMERALAVYGKDPLSAVLCAHIDRHGLISLGKNEYAYAAQYMKEIIYGESNRMALEEMRRIAERFEGESVYAYDPLTGRRLGGGTIATACQPHKESGNGTFYIEGMPDLPLGVPASYAREARVEGGLLKGQIDNAVSVAVVYELYRQGFEGTAILSTEEEIGKSWVHLESSLRDLAVASQNLIVLDTSPYTDPDAMERGRVIFRNRDGNAPFNTALSRLLSGRCADLGLPYEFKDEKLLAAGKSVSQLGSTELGKLILRTEEAWSGATVQVPTLMYHTSRETTSTEALKNYFLFLRNVLIEDKIGLLRAQQR